ARKTSGSSCVRIGCQIGFSNPSTISSTIAATLGTHSSTNPGRLCPSRDATGQQSVTQSEDWYKPFAQNFICVLSKQRRGLDFRRAPAETHRPARHLERAGDRVLHRLHDSALLEVCVLSQLHRVEDSACGHAGAAEHAHRLAFVVLTRPGGD